MYLLANLNYEFKNGRNQEYANKKVRITKCNI